MPLSYALPGVSQFCSAFAGMRSHAPCKASGGLCGLDAFSHPSMINLELTASSQPSLIEPASLCLKQGGAARAGYLISCCFACTPPLCVRPGNHKCDLTGSATSWSAFLRSISVTTSAWQASAASCSAVLDVCGHTAPHAANWVVGQRTLLVYCCCLVLPKVHCVFLLEPTACCARWPKGGVTHLNGHALSQSNMHTGVPEPL
jgi:hypothetical protein